MLPSHVYSGVKEVGLLHRIIESLYEPGSPSRALLDKISKTYVLVALVDNDYTTGDLWTGIFGEL